MSFKCLVFRLHRLCRLYEEVARVALRAKPDSFHVFLAWPPFAGCYTVVVLDGLQPIAVLDLLVDAKGRAEIAYASTSPCAVGRALEALSHAIDVAVALAEKHGAKTIAAKTLTREEAIELEKAGLEIDVEAVLEQEEILEEALKRKGFRKTADGWLKKL